MNLEQIEYRLTLLYGRRVMIVKPDFGKISFSFIGNFAFNSSPSGYVVFNFTSMSGDIAMIFTADDVSTLENETEICDEKNPKMPIIRLHGPTHYLRQTQFA